MDDMKSSLPSVSRIVDGRGLIDPIASAERLRKDARKAAARAQALANPAFTAHIFKPGQSGNPHGVGHEYKRCRALCKDASPDAANEIIRLFKESADDRVRYMAAQWCYEQAWGKAKEYDPLQDKEPLKYDFTQLSAEQRQQIRDALELLSATLVAKP